LLKDQSLKLAISKSHSKATNNQISINDFSEQESGKHL